MDDIKNHKYIYRYDDDNEEIDSLSFVKYLVVDINSKYLCLVGKSKVMIINI